MVREPEKKTRKDRIDPKHQAAVDGSQKILTLLDMNNNDTGDHGI